ncbi:hypothetical protein DKP78_14625 [Enterococcus faecium]|nr:hypothetical protein DKP78_14625 [Enterococcus faecium]
MNTQVSQKNNSQQFEFFLIGAKKFLHNPVMFRCGAKGSQKLCTTDVHRHTAKEVITVFHCPSVIKISELCAQPCRFSQCTCLKKKRKKKEVQSQPIKDHCRVPRQKTKRTNKNKKGGWGVMNSLSMSFF